MLMAPSPASPNSSYYSENNVLRFADYLYEEGDYERAAGEYQRYLILSYVLKDSIFFKIGTCYQLAGEHHRSIYFFKKVVSLFPHTDLLTSAYHKTAYSYFALGEYDSTEQLLRNAVKMNPSQVDRERLACMLGYVLLFQAKWRLVSTLVESLSVNHHNDDFDPCLAKLKASYQEGISLSRRSPLLSSIFSAIVPGAGKMYCGRYIDGLTSFVLIGTAAWQASSGFQDQGSRSQRGWIYATLGGILWVGNIYGSSVAAKIYNREQTDGFLTKIKLEIRF